MDFDTFLNPLGVVILLAFIAGLAAFFIPVTQREQAIDISPFGLPLGTARVSTGVVLVLASMAGAVWGVPALEVAKSKNELSALTGQLSARNEKIGRIETERDDALEALKEVERESERRQSTIDRQKSNLDRKEKQLLDAADTMNQAREELGRRLDRIVVQSTEIVSLKQQLEAAKSDLENSIQIAKDVASAANEAGLSNSEREELERVRRGIDAINRSLKYVSIREAPLLEIVGESALTNFEVYSKTFGDQSSLDRGFGLIDFPSESFSIDEYYSSSEIEAIVSEIAPAVCEAIGQSIVQDVSFEETIRRIPALEKYEGFAQELIVLSEFEHFRQRLQALAVDAEILVRGYADGERSGWSRALPEEIQPSAKVHPLANPAITSPLRDWRFLADETQYSLGQRDGSYSNEHLPNLRAVATLGLLEAIGTSCQIPGGSAQGIVPSVGILDGRLHTEYLGTDRKSRAFVSIKLR